MKEVFSSVAGSYDLMNDAMSAGVHRLWKNDFISMLAPGSSGPIKCLDVAGGTGDISFRILDHAREKYADRETEVTVSDINPDMLEEGKRRFKQSMYWNSKCYSSNFESLFRSLISSTRSSPSQVPSRERTSTSQRTVPRQHLRPLYHCLRDTELHVDTGRIE